MQFYYTIIIKSVIICEKKRGVYMKIDWKLFDDKETIIEKKDKLVKYEDGVIYYKDEYGTHRVDLINKIYERINESDIFRVDFTNEILTVKFANTDLKYNINASIKRLTDIQKGDGCGWTVIVSERDVRQAVAVLEQNSIKVLGVERLDIS